MVMRCISPRITVIGHTEQSSPSVTLPITTLAGSIWYDHDRDAVRDLDPASGETFAPGVEVLLLRDDRTEFARTTTDAEGRYEFPLLETGTYRIEVPASNFDGPLRDYDVIVGPDGSLSAGGYVSGPIVLGADRSVPVTVTHLGVAARTPSALLGSAGPLLLGPGLVLGTYGLLRRQRRRNRFGRTT